MMESSRRKFLTHCLKSTAMFVGVALPIACTTKNTSTETDKPVLDCGDLSGVNEIELDKRKKFAYARQSTDSEKKCSTCKLYLPPKPEEKCGACLLFKGPVDANGSCTYWAPLA